MDNFLFTRVLKKVYIINVLLLEVFFIDYYIYPTSFLLNHRHVS